MHDSRRPLDPRAALQDALAHDQTTAGWTAPGLDELAGRFPELLIEARIGQGGMAAVYRAVQKKLDRKAALKVLRPDLAREPEFVARFLREAKAMAQLSHPHVLGVYDFGERDGLCYLLAEYVDGANLRELMSVGQLTPAEALRLVPQICAGLQFAHDHGIVHRDIKPENVLVDRQGFVKLADFGLAKLAGGTDPHLTRQSMVFGTPHYMAPEQWRGSGNVDHRADIYSLGVVLYELLTGRLPVGTYEPPSKCAGVSDLIDRVVHRSLEQEPERRYQSAREVQREVEHDLQQPGHAPTTASRGWYDVAGVAVLGMIVAGVWARFRYGMTARLQPDERSDAESTATAVGDLVVVIIGLATVLLAATLLRNAARVARASGSRALGFVVGLLIALPFVAAIDIWLFSLTGGQRGMTQVVAGTVVLFSNWAVVHWLWQRTETWRPQSTADARPRAQG